MSTPEQPPLVPGGPVIRAGGGRNWKYKADLPGANGPLMSTLNDEATAKQLLERGEDVHARSSLGYCALTSAVMTATTLGRDGSNCLPTIDVLLEFGADPNATERRGKTAAHFCAFANLGPDSMSTTEAILRRLLDAGADLSLVDIDGYSPVRCAARDPALHSLFKRLEVEYAAKRKAWKQQLLKEQQLS